MCLALRGVLVFHLFTQIQLADFFHVVLDHDADEVFEGGFLGIPAQLLFGFCGITQELFDLGGTEVLGIDLDDYVSDFQLTAYG